MSQAIAKLAERRQEQKQIQSEITEAAGGKLSASENRPRAKRILALAVALSILVLGPLKLNARRSSVIKEFKSGTETAYTESAYNFIMDAKSSAVKLNGYAKTAGETDATRALDAAIARLDGIDDENELLKAYKSLYAAADTVYKEYIAASGSDSDTAKEVRYWYKNLESTDNSLFNIAYLASAEDFNQDRSAFPAKLLAGITGIKAVPAK